MFRVYFIGAGDGSAGALMLCLVHTLFDATGSFEVLELLVRALAGVRPVNQTAAADLPWGSEVSRVALAIPERSKATLTDLVEDEHMLAAVYRASYSHPHLSASRSPTFLQNPRTPGTHSHAFPPLCLLAYVLLHVLTASVSVQHWSPPTVSPSYALAPPPMDQLDRAHSVLHSCTSNLRGRYFAPEHGNTDASASHSAYTPSFAAALSASVYHPLVSFPKLQITCGPSRETFRLRSKNNAHTRTQLPDDSPPL